MIALGLFLAGAVYFGGIAVTRTGRRDALVLAGLCVLASGQLLSEIARLIWAYPYPVHGWRLLAIASFSAAFGLLTCYYVVRQLKPAWLWPVMVLAILTSVSALVLQSGFDAKSVFAMLGPLLFAFGVSLYVAARPAERLQGAGLRRRALISAMALLAVIAPNILIPDLFLNAVFFYLVAGLLLILLADQVRERSREQAEAVRETARANRLQLLLDQLDTDAIAPPLTIRSAGKVEQIPVADITTVQGADGYAEIHLSGGRAILHTKSLGALERELPSDFLKVHRSHIVNTTHVRALERDPSGTGALLLSNGVRIPVSRRILPRVRAALS
jgi:DNA-binding LytR/AlgR family response regulator